MAQTMPRVFIGSSSEGIHLARALQANLDRDVEATVWDQGCFRPSRTILNSLLQILDTYHFGILVLSCDDILELRGDKYDVPRDNLLFELGLFIGRLGVDRTFFVMPRDNSGVRLPTDLLGILPAEYDANRVKRNGQAAMGPASYQILSEIRDRLNTPTSLQASQFSHGLFRPSQTRSVFNDYKGERVVQHLWADPLATKHGGTSDAYIRACVIDAEESYLKVNFVRQGFGVNLTIRPMCDTPIDASGASCLKFKLRTPLTDSVGTRIRIVDGQDVCWGFGKENLIFHSDGLSTSKNEWSEHIVPLDPEYWFHFPYDGTPQKFTPPDFMTIKLITLEVGVEPTAGKPISTLHTFCSDHTEEAEVYISPILFE